MMTPGLEIARKSVPVTRLAWATDWHLNFLRPEPKRRFIESLARIEADALAISGDISDGAGLRHDLSELANSVAKPVFFVLGNHDRYHSSFVDADKVVADVAAEHPQLERLNGTQVIELSPHTAMVGVDGWADGLAGSGNRSRIRLNDSLLIRDLACLPHSLQWLKMKELADAYATAANGALDEAMAKFQHVIFLTHVPPVAEAAWHEGEMSTPDFLPYFSSPTLGAVLRAACLRWPDRLLTVLCGHTHGAGVYREGNLEIFTGGAEYGSPAIDRIMKVG